MERPPAVATIGEVSSEPGADERGAFTWYVITVCAPTGQWTHRLRSRWSQLDDLREDLLAEGLTVPPLPLTQACGLPLLHPWRNSDAVVRSRRQSIRAFLDACVSTPAIASALTLERFLGIDAHKVDDAADSAGGKASAQPATRQPPIGSSVLRSIDAHGGGDAAGSSAGAASSQPAGRRTPIDSSVLRSEIVNVERAAEQMGRAHSSLRARIAEAEEGSKRALSREALARTEVAELSERMAQSERESEERRVACERLQLELDALLETAKSTKGGGRAGAAAAAAEKRAELAAEAAHEATEAQKRAETRAALAEAKARKAAERASSLEAELQKRAQLAASSLDANPPMLSDRQPSSAASIGAVRDDEANGANAEKARLLKQRTEARLLGHRSSAELLTERRPSAASVRSADESQADAEPTSPTSPKTPGGRVLSRRATISADLLTGRRPSAAPAWSANESQAGAEPASPTSPTAPGLRVLNRQATWSSGVEPPSPLRNKVLAESQGQIDVGARVQTEGLDQRPELNHRTGTVVDRRSFGRWTVELDDGSKHAFNEHNLRPVNGQSGAPDDRNSRNSMKRRASLSFAM